MRSPPPPAPVVLAAARGFTLVEAAVVLALLAIVAGLAAPSLRAAVEMRRLQGAASALATDLRFVRVETVARRMPLRLSLRPLAAGSCYVIHTGAADRCSCDGVDEGPAACSGGAVALRTVRLRAVDGVGVQANVGSMLFDPVHGTTTPTGTLKVIGTTRGAVHHVVNILGRVRSCTPNGAVPGYAPC